MGGYDMTKKYYKGLDENMCGRNGFQYNVGGEFTANTDDNWCWLHFARKVTDAVQYGKRVVEVEPVTTAHRYGSDSNMNAKTIRIVRELSRDEILGKLVEEKCRICMMTKFEPTYDELVRIKDHIRRSDYTSIACNFKWLTADERIALLPRIWAERVRIYERGQAMRRKK
jgi:hypothetical protein